MFGGNFAPVGWAFCNGALMAITDNQTLFQLIGTTYGGDGQSTFALPDLQSRVPVHQGQGPGLTNQVIGEKAGAETVTLTANQITVHTHPGHASSAAATASSPSGNVWASGTTSPFSDQAADAQMNAAAIQSTGGSQPHDNMLPFVAVNFIISLFGVFPSQT
jgi:microcystin-dependent protein